jgi:hypothetical protein
MHTGEVPRSACNDDAVGTSVRVLPQDSCHHEVTAVWPLQ